MLIVPASVYAAVQTHARITLPEECCGALIGKTSIPGELTSTQIEAAFPLPNTAVTNRETRYFIDPCDVLRIDKSARARGLDIVGFYHSHPKGPAVPSKEDARQAWESCLYLIVAVEDNGKSSLRVWQFKDGQAHEIAINISQ